MPSINVCSIIERKIRVIKHDNPVNIATFAKESRFLHVCNREKKILSIFMGKCGMMLTEKDGKKYILRKEFEIGP